MAQRSGASLPGRRDITTLLLLAAHAARARVRAAGVMLVSPDARGYRILLGGQAVSLFGDAFYAVAFPWLVFGAQYSPQDLGFLLAAFGIPRVLALAVGGSWSDRWHPRTVMIGADAARMVLLGALAVLSAQGHPSIGALCAIAIPFGAASGIFLPASFAILPKLLPGERLQAGNALASASAQLVNLLGPGIAGVIIATGHVTTAFALDAATFAISVGTLAVLPGRSGAAGASAEDEPQSLDGSGLAAGEAGAAGETGAAGAEQVASQTFGQLLRTSRLLQAILLIAVIGNLFGGGLLEVALPALARGPLGGAASGYGALLMAFSAGCLLGTLTAAVIGPEMKRGMLALVLQLIQAAAFALLGGAHALPLALLALGVAGAANGLSNVLFMTLLQQGLPQDFVGRAMGILMLSVFGLYPLSVAVTGLLILHLGLAAIFTLSALCICLGAGSGLLVKALRQA